MTMSKDTGTPENRKSRIGLAIIGAAFLLIVLVLTFTGGLIISSFQDDYEQSIVSNYAVSGNDTVRKIEYAVRYGKPLENFYGIEDMLEEKLLTSEQVSNIFIANADGEYLYNQDGQVLEEQLPEALRDAFMEQAEEGVSFTFDRYENHYYVFLPIQDDEGNWTGSMITQFHERVITVTQSEFLWSAVNELIIMAIAATLLIAVVSFLYPMTTKEGQVSKKRILTTFIVVLGLVQGIFGYMNYGKFSEAYIELANNNAVFVSDVIQSDVEHLVEQGVRYDQLFHFEPYLAEIAESVNEIAFIRLNINDGGRFYDSAGGGMPEADEAFLSVEAMIPDGRGQTAQIETVLSESYYSARMQEIVLDTVTVIVTSFLFMVEVALLVVLFLNRAAFKKNRKQASLNTEKQEVPQTPGLAAEDEEAIERDETAIVRPLTFMFAMAIFLSASFIPLAMNQIYEPIAGLSREVVLGLPISAEMLFAGIGTIAAGFLIDRYGWKPLFISGVLFFMTGSLLAGFASNPIEFIGARSVVGVGYGFGLMALRGFVNSSQTEVGRSDGFAFFFAGMYAGLNIGVIVGAMLADRIGFSNVFFVAFGIATMASIFALTSTKNRKLTKKKAEETDMTEKPKGGFSIARFFANRKILALFLLIVVPTTIVSMFLDYYFPVFADAQGFSTSNVGRAFLLNGICIVYLAPLLSKYTAKYLKVEQSIVLSALVMVSGVLFFAWQGTLAAAFVAVILLGVAESFGLVAQNSYFVKLEATNQLGTGKALGFYDNIRKLGQMAGPMVFGGLAFMGLMGVGTIALIGLASALLFLLVIRSQSPREAV